MGRKGSIVTLIGDSGRRYRGTYYDDDWLRRNGIDIRGHLARLHAWLPPRIRSRERAHQPP
ncbi:hypothetical protein DP939_16150 [Spongiactinospora rosea]|uniref:Uncharacterized protein n=1 Tax=Spongiactinospora rosea TaxID=2248750 RepID=A0A366LZR0_9ACTN|nr:hypothetical protein [Spongiactinospora rosea]RBQ19445.1 hypothetical protein DP939_16150 [Spongiactinospora rosea]